MEKSKNGDVGNRTSRPVVAVVLVVLGITLLLINLGVFSSGAIGAWFGTMGASFGQFFGNLGGSLGQFFGGIGESFGQFFGTLGRSFAQLWPLALILVGATLLFWRKKPRQE